MNKIITLALITLLSQSFGIAQSDVLLPSGETDRVPNDADDPAIWVHPTDPARSLIFGTDKIDGQGGLYVFGLDGDIKQSFIGMDRPNNVDVGYGLGSGTTRMDIAVVTERYEQRLRVFGIFNGVVSEVTPNGIPVLEGESGTRSQPMGIALYERPSDGAVFAIVAPKSGSRTDYLWQYRLTLANGIVTGTLVRRFGNFSGHGEIEAVAVDDALGYVYYADEDFGIHKWHADPDRDGADEELAVLGRNGYEGDREGLAIYANADGSGFLVSADQVSRASRLLFYPRQGERNNPHDQPLLATVETRASSTDGIEVTERALPGFPAGMLVMMNSGKKNFLIYDWRDVMKQAAAALAGQ